MKNKSPNNYLLQHENGTRIGMDYIQGRLQKLFNQLFNDGLDKKGLLNSEIL